MQSTKDKTTRIEAEKELVRKVASDDPSAVTEFVERFTDWTLFKAKEWCIGHCRESAGSVMCGLLSLQLQRGGKIPESRLPECDEGLDTYIWIIEQIKRRSTKYSGKNNCLLSTYIWTILNSKEFYIDWLRWKYGRAF